MEKKVRIFLRSVGRYNRETNVLITPTSIEELENEINSICFGYHCDYDEVRGAIVIGSDDTEDYDVSSLEWTDNLLYVGHNCEDDVVIEEDGRYSDGEGNYFDDYDDVLEYYTNQDFGGDIRNLFEDFNNSIN